MSYFGNSVPEMHTTQEDYKPVIICVHCCQIPIHTSAMSICSQLLFIFILLHIEPMSIKSMNQINPKSMGRQHNKHQPSTLLFDGKILVGV